MLSTLFAVASVALAAPPQVTFQSLLSEMTDRSAVARYPVPSYLCAQASSYDRASTSPSNSDTWFANGDYNQFIRVEEINGRKEWVMMDQAGPGAVVRIWSANPKGVLRVYVDGGTTPVLEGPMADMLGGKNDVVGTPLSQESARGWNLYLPIPYAKHCKVTSDSDKFYYQVNYRTYDKGSDVVSASAALLKSNLDAIKAANKKLIEDNGPEPKAPPPPKKKLAPGAEYAIDLPEGPHAIESVRVSISAKDMEQAGRSVVVVGTFDGEQTIWCPLSEFFGSGVGVNEYRDWYRSVQKPGEFSCRWVMPYAKTGSIKLVNLGKDPVGMMLLTDVRDWAWNDSSMHFFARWRSDYPIHALAARGTEDYNYVEVKGAGVYVGDNLSLMNPVPEWWGEGDEKVFVDGEAFPSHFGTGTEDYYGYAWGASIKFEHPFHAQPRVDGQKTDNCYGQTTVTRTRSLDAIPFTKSLKFDIEVWHWKECDVAYAATSYFYAKPGATHNRPAIPDAARAAIVQAPPLPPPFAIEGAIECEGLKVVKATQDIDVGGQGMGSFRPRTWSGEGHLWVQGKRVGDFVELQVPCEKGKAVKVALHATRSWDYGIIRFSIDGKQVGKDTDLFSGAQNKVEPTGPIDLGVIEPKGDSFILRAEVVGGNEKSMGSKAFFGLDCLVLTPAK
ncbi:MAG: glycoside hydrolase family 172 protein [Phycisphaerales bacterium]